MKLLKLSLLSVALGLAGSADAATFSNRAAFLAATPSAMTNNLNGFSIGPITSVFGLDSISSDGLPGGYISAYPEFGNALTGSNGNLIDPFAVLTLTFSTSVTAFGFDNLDLSGGTTEYANILINFANGDAVSHVLTDPDFDYATAPFFGVASATPIASISIYSSTTAGARPGERAHYIDNLLIGTSAVPEPQTWAMMIGGLGFAGGALRRERRRTLARIA